MNATNKALSAYVPTHATAPPPLDFELPLQVYIIETIERDARHKLLRQLSMVGALVLGLFISQWPMNLSSANAVPTLPVSAHAMGARPTSPVVIERLAFAPRLPRT